MMASYPGGIHKVSSKFWKRDYFNCPNDPEFIRGFDVKEVEKSTKCLYVLEKQLSSPYR